MPSEITTKHAACVPSRAFLRQGLALLTVLAVCGLLQAKAFAATADHARVDYARADDRQVQLRMQLQTQLQEQLKTEADDTATAIRNFYLQRQFAPVWLNAKRLTELRQLGKLADVHGLDADDYQLTDLGVRIDQLLYSDSNEELARLDLLATRSVARLANHLKQGKVMPKGRYTRVRDSADAELTVELLADAARSPSLFAYLDQLPPDTLLYRKLQLSLAQHRAMPQQGADWPVIPEGSLLKPGMVDSRVPALRARLELPAEHQQPTLYDAALAAAVAEFQRSHLLTDDGLLGRRTVNALNVSLPERINQLRVNLDWQRWAAMPTAGEYLRVNIAHYNLQLIQDGARTWSTRVQVGKAKRQTPVFKSTVNAIMANPTWTVPPTIFREDVLPQLQTDPDYLRSQNMYVVDNRGQPVDTSHIDWRQTTAAEFPYRVRARPSAGNALGRMKFLIPNPYLIYLHDTPSKHLFEQESRNYSSGCIRIEQPERLAEFLVERQNKISPARLQAALAADGTRFLGLDQPMPIVIMYATVDLDDNGELVFARDVYGKDRQVLAALDTLRPADTRVSLASAN